jgi:hypothetical protein
VDPETFIILVQPGAPLSICMLDRASGDLLPLDSSTPLPHAVLSSADWLSAFAEKRALPPGTPPPAVFRPRREGEPFVAVVSVSAE